MSFKRVDFDAYGHAARGTCDDIFKDGIGTELLPCAHWHWKNTRKRPLSRPICGHRTAPRARSFAISCLRFEGGGSRRALHPFSARPSRGVLYGRHVRRGGCAHTSLGDGMPQLTIGRTSGSPGPLQAYSYTPPARTLSTALGWKHTMHCPSRRRTLRYTSARLPSATNSRARRCDA